MPHSHTMSSVELSIQVRRRLMNLFFEIGQFAAVAIAVVVSWYCVWEVVK